MFAEHRVGMYTVGAVIAFAAVFLAALSVGRYSVPLDSVWAYLSGDLSHGSTDYKVLADLRLPRTLVAACVGVGLALSGLLYQETFQNKLVSPDFLGVTSGASVGAALAILWGLSGWEVSAYAFVFGVVTVFLTLALSRAFMNRSPTILLMSGIIIGGLMGAFLSIIKYVADPDSTLASITFWMMGSCEGTTMEDVKILLPIVAVCSAVVIAVRWKINLVSLGKAECQSKGVNFRFCYLGIIVLSTLMTAAAVAAVGCVGWIGLTIPHMARILVGRNTANTIPLTIAFGAIFMVLVDILSRSYTDSEIPLSAITGILGAALFIVIIAVRRRNIIDRD